MSVALLKVGRQVDAVTYSDIATVELRDNVGDLFVDADDELLAVMEARPPPAHRPRVRALAQGRVPSWDETETFRDGGGGVRSWADTGGCQGCGR